jgi:signal transduction histidine kinase
MTDDADIDLYLPLLQLLPEPVLLLSPDGLIRRANTAASTAVSRHPGGLDGQVLGSLVLDAPDKLSRYLFLSSRSRSPIPGSLTWMVANEPGRTLKTRCDGAVLRPAAPGRPALVFLRCPPPNESPSQFKVLNEKIAALTREIVHRKSLQTEREALLESERAARLDAERVSRMKDEFLATLSHELRTPLNAILGWSQLLRMTDLSPADATQGLETIERNARMQVQLIEDLLDMSRIISGKMRLDVQRVDLATIIQAALDAVRPAADAKNVRLQSVLDPLAGPIAGDPNRLQQVVWNLLSNSVKFTPKGGRVQVLLERVNSHVEISVTDTGAGIRPEHLPHVFDRFWQSDASTTRKYGGLGLGLSIVKQLVDVHGGQVRAKSPGEGLGATFIISLPLPLARADAHPARHHPTTPSPDSAPCPPIDLAGLTVLVVDDESDARLLVVRILQACHANALTAASSADALDLLQRSRPDVLISDIGMPDEDGYELIRKVRALPPDRGGKTPAVAVTAFARSEDRRRALLAGFQLHLAKPIEPAELTTVVASLAGRT